MVCFHQFFDSFNRKFVMSLKGELSHNFELGSDAFGNCSNSHSPKGVTVGSFSSTGVSPFSSIFNKASSSANIAKNYPKQIEVLQERIRGFQTDMETVRKNLPADKDNFSIDLGISKCCFIHILTASYRRFTCHDLADEFLLVFYDLPRITVKGGSRNSHSCHVPGDGFPAADGRDR